MSIVAEIIATVTFAVVQMLLIASMYVLMIGVHVEHDRL